MWFPKQEYWSGLPCLSPGNFLDPGIKSTSPALTDSPPLAPPRKARATLCAVLSHSVVSDSLRCYGLQPVRLCPRDSPGKSTGAGCHALLQGIFPAQVSRTVGGFFTIWTTRVARCLLRIKSLLEGSLIPSRPTVQTQYTKGISPGQIIYGY